MDGIEKRVENLSKKFAAFQEKKTTLEGLQNKWKAEAARKEKKLEAAKEARAILQKAAEMTQKNMEARISSLVTSALEGVFPDPYEFVVRFVQKRGKTECDLLFKKNGEEIKPVKSSGGGALDIASFALRVSFWCLDKTRPVIILDEPFKWLSEDLQEKAGQLLQNLSKKLGIQFIIVTHIKPLLPYGDKIIYVEKGEVKEINETVL